MEPGSIQHSGYLTPGDEINVQGGFTVHFQKKHRRYWTLQYFGEGNLTLCGYKDEKSFRKSSSSSSTTKTSTLGRQRKLSSAPIETIRLMTSLKVHKFEIKTKKKVENALIIVNGSHPKFFRPDNNAELDTWHSVFMKFSSDTRSIKRRVRPDKKRHSPNHQTLDPSDNLERDSGVSTSFTRSTCESERSSSSSMSSEEMTDYSPQRFFPSTISFDLEDDDHNTSPVPSPTLRERSGRQTSSISRRSTFFRNSEGIYEERTSLSPRESTESGFYDTVLHRNEDGRSDSVYDVLPPSPTSSPRPVSATTINNEHHVIPANRLRKSKSSSFDNTDSSIPEEDEKDIVNDVTATLAKKLGVENSAELQQILNDDGSTHTYINQRLPFKSASPLLSARSPRIPDRPPNLPRRKHSLGVPISETDYQQHVLPGERRRSESMPISLEDSVNPKYSPRSSQQPIPEVIKPHSDIEALMAEQARDVIEVHINKEDLVDSIALVDIRGKVIIAGWKRCLIGKLHVGDQLVQVNDQVVSQTEWANTFIKTSSRSTIVLHVNRLPFAKIINCTRIHEDTLWGFECKANEITSVRSGPAKESGLTEKSESSAFSKKSCEWIITEAANKPIRLNCPKDEMMQYLATRDLELPLVVQPKDFIHDLNKALNKLKRSSFYRVG